MGIGFEMSIEDDQRFRAEESAPFADLGGDRTDSGSDSADVVDARAVVVLLLTGVSLFFLGLFKPILQHRSNLHGAARRYVQFLEPRFQFQLITSPKWSKVSYPTI